MTTTTVVRADATEEALAADVVAWLRGGGFDVHEEVAPDTSGRRVDVVALLGPLVWAIEVKRSLSWAVCDQADRWRRRNFAHRVSVAVPATRSSDGSQFARRVLRDQGIGLLEIGRGWRGESGVSEVVPARLHRPRHLDPRLRAACCEETRSGIVAAGSAGGAHWSPFMRTKANIRRALEAGPLTTRELIDRIEHHYASAATARSALWHWLTLGKIDGVEVVPGRPAKWKLTGSA